MIVGVVGTGYWGRNHVRVYNELRLEGLIDELYICDSNEETTKRLGTEFNVHYTTNYKELIAKVDAVSIVTPSIAHYEIAKDFMESGVNVLVEKPMTMNVKEAKELVEVSRDAKRVLMVGHLFRLHPAVVELKKRVDRREFGEIINIVSERLHFGVPRRDMGVIYALGIHELDMFCYLLNREFPNYITASSHSIFSNVEETAIISVDFGDVKGYAVESWVIPVYGKKRELVVVGSEKSARIDYLDPQRLHIYDVRFLVEDGHPVKVEDEGSYHINIPYAEPLKEEIKHFLDCIKVGKKPIADGVVGMRAVSMAEAALESARTKKSIEIGEYVGKL